MFRKDQFIADCQSAGSEGQQAIRELVLDAVADPSSIISELGEPTKAGVYPLYKGEALTVINFVWAPCMTLLPHNHNMFAVIGIYAGREDNVFWRRIGDSDHRDTGPEIEAAGAESMGPRASRDPGPRHYSFCCEPDHETDERHSRLRW